MISESLLVNINNNTFSETQLVLEDFEMNYEDALNLVNVIKLNKYIKKIFFGAVNIVDKEAAALFASLTNIDEIIFIEGSITDAAARELLKSQVKVLWLEAASLTDACLEGIEDNKTLIELSLSRNNFTVRGIEMLSRNRNIKNLDLSCCLIRDNCIAQLVTMKSLEAVNLRDNMITDVGFKILNDSSIREINLEQNNNNNCVEKITPDRLQYRCSLKATFPAFEASKKPETKEAVEKEVLVEVEMPAKRLQGSPGA